MKRSLWSLAVIGCVVMLWLVVATADASPQATVTLNEGQQAKVLPNGCNLTVLKETPDLVKVKCVAMTTPDGNRARALHPEGRITLGAGKAVKILSNNCDLSITKKTASLVKVICNPKANTVMVGQNGTTYTPQQITIHQGETVHWEWASNNHTVTSGTAPNADGLFCSPNDTNCASAPASNSGATYEHTFNSQGTFKYFCLVHGSAMTGSVVVEP